MDIILASKSPRRNELLSMLGIKKFKIIPSECDEEISNLPPEETVAKIAVAKACDVRAQCKSDDLIIAADTLVYFNGEALGKPNNESDAKAMLHRLSGNRHTVYTGVAILKGNRIESAAEITHVYFRALTEREIDSYIKTGEPMDKAGAYGAQGRGALLVERIEGDFFNVMGLPLCRLYKMLLDFGVDLFGSYNEISS